MDIYAMAKADAERLAKQLPELEAERDRLKAAVEQVRGALAYATAIVQAVDAEAKDGVDKTNTSEVE